MALFPQKTKTVEVTYIDKLMVVIGGQKFHRHDHEIQEIRNTLALIIKNQKKIMATQKELAQQLTDLGVEVGKVGAETTVLIQKVADLEAALANQDNVSPELQAAFEALKAQVQVVDDLVPDAPTP